MRRCNIMFVKRNISQSFPTGANHLSVTVTIVWVWKSHACPSPDNRLSYNAGNTLWWNLSWWPCLFMQIILYLWIFKNIIHNTIGSRITPHWAVMANRVVVAQNIRLSLLVMQSDRYARMVLTKSHCNEPKTFAIDIENSIFVGLFLYRVFPGESCLWQINYVQFFGIVLRVERHTGTILCFSNLWARFCLVSNVTWSLLVEIDCVWGHIPWFLSYVICFIFQMAPHRQIVPVGKVWCGPFGVKMNNRWIEQKDNDLYLW